MKKSKAKLKEEEAERKAAAEEDTTASQDHTYKGGMSPDKPKWQVHVPAACLERCVKHHPSWMLPFRVHPFGGFRMEMDGNRECPVYLFLGASL